MALREIWIGTQGPFLIDDTDPEFAYSGQVATKTDLDGIASPATYVETSTAFGIVAAIGTSDDYARADHQHGTPTNPVSGVTADVVVGAQTLHFTNGLLTSIT